MGEPSLSRDEFEPDKHGQEEDRDSKEGGLLSFLGELPILILTAIVVAWLIKTFLVQPFFIPSSSMETTLMPGDRVLVSKLDYRFGEPKVGNVIVFESPEGPETKEPQDFIKRIVALGGMEVEVDKGKLVVDGKMRKEDFTRPDRADTIFGPYRVPLGTVFVMGDNRANSRDSRFFGPVDKDKIIGRAFVVYWPPDRAGLIR